MTLPKKYNFLEREDHWKQYWEENNIYEFDEQSPKPIFSIDTPPPYVSAEHLHIGHIMSYSQAEFVVRFMRMQGYNVFYPMGFDDNGLPTERFVEKKYHINKLKISRGDFIKLCLQETEKGIKNYKDLWINLGISVDWSKTYSTINPLCQKVSQRSFIDLFEKGRIYRKKEPMLWCPSCQTALAQADLEDKKTDAYLNYILFSIANKKYAVATTRPELIPACVALFAHPQDKRYTQLKKERASVPLFNYSIPIYFDQSVDPEYGTGLMMVCSWGDAEDIKKMRSFDLLARELFDEQGRITALGGKLKGFSILEARKQILEDLKNKKLLIKQTKIQHVVNIHERCETPVEYILTKQWFIDILNIKDELLKRGEELNWYPKHIKDKYDAWIKGLKWDWCISRQRYYGVPFPIWYCKKCTEIIVAQKKDLPVDPTEKDPPISKCLKCGSNEFIPETDVMDTWATSSCTPFIISELVENTTCKKRIFPNSLRPQAFEIIRTWLFYSIVKSHYNFNKLPFKNAMISGHGLDEKGKKISKRLGNYTEPSQLLKEYGADAIRYWATGAKLGTNHRFDLKDVKKGKHTVTKIWNAACFCSMNFNNFIPQSEKNYVLEPEDNWILHQLNQTVEATTNAFKKYEYSEVRNILHQFFWSTFCDYYLEMVKHRTNENAAKYTMFTCLINVLKLYAPIFPFITEEIWQHLFKNYDKEESIHKTTWPATNKNWKLNEKQLKEIKNFIEEIDAVREEKTAKKLRYKDILENYVPKTKVNLKIFGDKLKKMLYVHFL